MDLGDLAALIALAGIPVTALVGHWQKRAVLAQAEAAHRTAMAQAEAAHRTALEVAEKTHRGALEVLRRQNQAETERRRREERHARYMGIQNALSEMREAVFAEPYDPQAVREAGSHVHRAEHALAMHASRRVSSLARGVTYVALRIIWPRSARSTISAAHAPRYWAEEVAPLRRELDEAVRDELEAEAEAEKHPPDTS
ncbi:hypothetical protein Sfulv_60610 [Streptomyces fulvorobeus]|uniref:Uncharacterized protein n=1 Tax=Streptomyces fulvorobeus TaxID=284028 RepID=A0A7J0CFH3_9ACTN|nr:hypothetical protein Sfulv_60610 [Streptomyces fulvorobeus]